MDGARQRHSELRNPVEGKQGKDGLGGDYGEAVNIKPVARGMLHVRPPTSAHTEPPLPPPNVQCFYPQALGAILGSLGGLLLLSKSLQPVAWWASGVYVAALVLQMGASAFYHLPNWSPASRLAVRKLDHCGVHAYVFIRRQLASLSDSQLGQPAIQLASHHEPNSSEPASSHQPYRQPTNQSAQPGVLASLGCYARIYHR